MKLLVDMNLSPRWIDWEHIRPDAIGRYVIVALQQMAAELDDGALLTIDPNRTRLRILPLLPKG